MLGEMGIALQQTLAGVTRCRGIGLHCGQPVAMTLHPALPNTGIVFRRVDAGAEIRASWTSTAESALSTVLSNGEGIQIGTIEHLMAALAGTVPQDAARRAFKVLKPVWVSANGAAAALLPEHGFSMSFEIDFDNPLIRRQDITLNFEPGTFRTELAPARTFGLLDDWPRLKAAGLARGGSLDNAIVVSGNRVLNDGGLRFTDEFVRHKLVDALGDLYLAGGPIIGHFRGLRSGHALTRRLVAALFADRDAWCDTTIAETAGIGTVAWPEAPRVAR